MNTDELFELMQRDEEEDARYITPVNYGRLRGIAPQLIYYYIRTHKITYKRCDCGRKVIEKEEADEYLRSVGKLSPLVDSGDGQELPGAEESSDGEGPSEHASGDRVAP
jgi:hypothetical protein